MFHGIIQNDLPVVHDDDPLTELFNISHVMAGQKDRCVVLPVHLPDQVPDLLFHHRIQPDGRLIQEKHLRPVDQGRHDLTADALSQRKIPHRRIDKLMQLESLRQLTDPVFHLFVRNVIDCTEETEIIIGRQMRPKLFLLAEHRPDLVRQLSALFRRIDAQHFHPAAVRIENSRQHLDRGALAGAVWPDKCQHLPFFHLERNPVHCPDLFRLRPQDRFDAAPHSLFLPPHPECLR